jgi:hypothetical protein
MSAAFAEVRRDIIKEPPAEPGEIKEPEPPPECAAASTLAAASYLVAQRDPERLRQWLANHSAEERRDIFTRLSKGSRHAAA